MILLKNEKFYLPFDLVSRFFVHYRRFQEGVIDSLGLGTLLCLQVIGETALSLFLSNFLPFPNCVGIVPTLAKILLPLYPIPIAAIWSR